MKPLKNRKVLVLGLGISGRSAARFLLTQQSIVTAVDSNAKLLESDRELAQLASEGVRILHDSEINNIEEYSLIVTSPGIPPTYFLYAAAKKKNIELIGEIELAARHLKGTCLGITGSNGKTTVTLLTTHILNQSGIPARALGNSGVPLTAQLLENDASDTVLVIELSSFQLETIKTPFLDAAIILNITPNHLDRHPTMESYIQAKFHIQNCLKKEQALTVFEECYHQYPQYTKKQPKCFGYTRDCAIHTDLEHLIVNNKILSVLPSVFYKKKHHDLENMMAAYTLCHELGVSPQQFMSAHATFQKPPHRIQFVAKINEVFFYDDSKGTNLEAVMRAVESLNGPIVLIAGGKDKGSAYTPWIQVFRNKVKYVCAIGEAAQKIKNDLGHEIPVTILPNLEKAVIYASQVSGPGENVLLSPGCSSYDMFQDYIHRGKEFQRVVNQLKGAASSAV